MQSQALTAAVPALDTVSATGRRLAEGANDVTAPRYASRSEIQHLRAVWRLKDLYGSVLRV